MGHPNIPLFQFSIIPFLLGLLLACEVLDELIYCIMRRIFHDHGLSIVLFGLFILCLGFYITPAMVGGASGLLLPKQLADFFKNLLIPEGSAIGFMIVVFVTVLLVIFRRYLRVEDVYARG